MLNVENINKNKIMKVNGEFNGERLKIARKYRGKTIKDLAEEVGVSKQAISQFENGSSSPSYETLIKIVKELKFPLEFFCENDNINLQSGNTYFRSSSKMTKKEESIQKEKTRLIGKVFSFLNEYIEFPKLDIPNLNNDLTIEEMALQLRNYWGIGEEPIADMVYLLEKNGIIITSMNTNSNNIDAFSQKQIINGEKRYLIVLGNDKYSATRRQFSVAHELGHIMMHDGFCDIEDLTREEIRNMEDEAHTFAAAFLLPKYSFSKDVIAYPTNLEHYKQLKKKWRTSISAMIVRANHLGVLSNSSYQMVMKKMSAIGWRKKEPLDDTLIMSKPTVLRRAVDILIDNNILDEDRIINELSEIGLTMPREEIELLLGLDKGKLKCKNIESKVVKMPIRNIESN